MDKYTATEMAYKNGFEAGQQEAAEQILSYICKQLDLPEDSLEEVLLGFEATVADLKKKYRVK